MDTGLLLVDIFETYTASTNDRPVSMDSYCIYGFGISTERLQHMLPHAMMQPGLSRQTYKMLR